MPINVHKTVHIPDRWTSTPHSRRLPLGFRAIHDDLFCKSHQSPSNPTPPCRRIPIYSGEYPSSIGRFRNKAVPQRHYTHTLLPAHFPPAPKLERPEDKSPTNRGSKQPHYTNACSIPDHCVPRNASHKHVF